MNALKTLKTDLLIIGSGIAGLRAGLAVGETFDVSIITKGEVRNTGTGQAQGGIAAALDEKDSPEAHLEDTLVAGAGLCDREAGAVLVHDGIARVKELIEWGCQFDRGPNGLAFGQEAAHRHRRILHAGDTTGAEIEKTLGRRILQSPRVKIIEHTAALTLVIENNQCFGAIALNSQTGELIFYQAQATLLATGGLGQIFLATTNPDFATADGLALAWRAGASVSDLEFIQFHPTTLAASHLGESRKSVSVFLISEAVRGEGAFLRNASGERFMIKYHPLAELAPRDIVARAIVEEMKIPGVPHVFLDLSHIDANFIKNRFPMIYSRLLELNIDMTKDQIPVAPAAHYFMGGVKTDLAGRTTIAGLYAAGEAASVGVHGANRLASNSLLDGLVFGYRAAEAIKKQIESNPVSPEAVLKENIDRLIKTEKNNFNGQKIRQQIKTTMWQKVGIIRNGTGLAEAQEFFTNLLQEIKLNFLNLDELEIANMALAGWLISRAALTRKESRGAHFRIDFPKTDNVNWRRHLVWNFRDNAHFLTGEAGQRRT